MNHTRPCGVHGCASPVRSRYSPFCASHRKALLRHGAADQTAIKAAELKPFEALIEKRQKANEGSRAWAILRERWSTILAQADAWVSEAGRKNDQYTELLNAVSMQVGPDKVGYRLKHHHQAAKLLKEVAIHAGPDKVVRTGMAVAMHGSSVPHRYKGDKALRYALVRRVIKLAPISIGRSYDHKARKVRTVSKDIPARTMDVLAGLLFPALAGAGAQLHAIEQRRRPPEEVERQQLADALVALKV